MDILDHDEEMRRAETLSDVCRMVAIVSGFALLLVVAFVIFMFGGHGG